MNPFSIITPENAKPEELSEIFVTNEDFSILEQAKNTFLHGYRGSGKSMYLQMLKPQFYMLYKDIDFKELPFLAVYISIKKTTSFNTQEFKRLQNSFAELYLCEHQLCLHTAINICDQLKEFYVFEDSQSENIKDLVLKIKSLMFVENELFDDSKFLNKEFLLLFKNFCENEWQNTNKYIKQLAFKQNIEYQGNLFTFKELIVPLIESLQQMKCFENKCIYLLFDDADNLEINYTKVLNTWISFRQTDTICFKISTQTKYKTYFTYTGQRIEMPHDYNEIYTEYTASSTKKEYIAFLENILIKRFTKYCINQNVPDYFPSNKEQDENINIIRKYYIERFENGEGRGNQKNDDANRYAIPDYIKSLGGSSKQTSTYLYCGFKQLAYISSGIVRDFLETASKMHHEIKAKLSNTNEQILFISPQIQDKVVRGEADNLIDSIDKIENVENEMKIKLKNLIDCLGNNFYKSLISDDSERKYFSFAISDDKNIDEEIRHIIGLGIEHGFFYTSKIGRKDSSGRTTLYILTRKLAPYYKLDPNGFAGYQFLTVDFLKKAIKNPKVLLKKHDDKQNEASLFDGYGDENYE